MKGWRPLEIGDARVEARVDSEAPQGHRRLWPSVGEYPVYDDFLYYVMLQDEPRNKLFRRAITEQAAGRVVVELGTGPDLLWASLAANSGASRVLAVEEIEDSAREAKRRARDLGQHVAVIHGNATEISLPVKGNMCIAELVGAIGGSEGIADAVDDAFRRHLEPGAVVVPHRVRTRIAAVEAGDLLGGPPALHPDVVPYLESVLRSVNSVFDVRMCLTGLTHADLLTTTGLLEDLNLGANIQHHPRHIRLEVTRPGLVDSGLLWLELQCAPDQEFLDSLATITNWMPVLLPFDTDHPIPVQPGDTIEFGVTRRLHDAIHPEWTFNGTINRRDGSRTPIHSESPYAGGPFRQSWLHRALLRDA